MQISMFEGKHPFKITKPLRLIELFAGIGAQAKALENLGIEFEHYRICELDKYAVASYNAVHGTNFATSDITKIHAADLGIVETDKYEYIMTYSFPCTDLSTAGRQAGMKKGSRTRSGLLWEVERLLTEMKELPQVLVMENVPQVIGTKNIKYFAEWVSVLDNLGYNSKWEILNAKDFGIPQNRSRFFMVSILGNYFYDFPNKIMSKMKLKDFVEFKEEWIISPDKLTQTQKNCIAHISNETFSKTIRSGGLKSRDRHEWAVYSVELRQSEKFIKNKSLWIKNLSKTICACHLNSYTIDGKIYFDYSPKECWRLMGFDDESFFRAKEKVSPSQLYKEAGNSIVVTVLMAIFGQIFDINWGEKINKAVKKITLSNFEKIHKNS